MTVKFGPDGKPTTDNGKIKVLLEGQSRIVYNIKDHNLILIEYIDVNGNTIAYATPLEGEQSIQVNDADNSIKSGRFINREKQIVIDKKDNEVIRLLATPKSNMTQEQLQELLENGVEARYLDGVTIDYEKTSGEIKIQVDPDSQQVGEFEGKTTYFQLISANGISNKLGEYTAPEYEQRLKYRLSQAGIDENTILLVPMYEGSNGAAGLVRDISMWALDNAGTNILTSELIAKLDREIYGDVFPGQQYTPKTMVLYSGSTNPFIKAINKRHDYIIKDAIILGGPTLDGMYEDTQVTNPNLQRVFNVWGSKDLLFNK